MNPTRLFIHRFRRPIAAACAALAVVLLASTCRAQSPDVVDVIAAATDLPAGATLAATDLQSRAFPRELLPPVTHSEPEDVIGRVIAGPIAAGEVITDTRLVDTGPRADGLRLVPVRLSDPGVADLLAPGTLVDLVGVTGGTQGQVLAEGVQVVTVPRQSRDAGIGGTARAAGSLIVVAADPQTAVALASTATQPGLGLVMR